MSTIGWGVIGCGDVCEVKSVPGMQLCGDSRVVSVMRRDAARAEDFARRHGVPRWTTNPAEVIADPEVDIVYVATPVGSHLEYALAVAAAGKPCLVEKPMARSHAECVRMMEAFERAGQPLFVAYYRRLLPWFVHAGDVIASGRLGTLTSVNVRFASGGQRQPATGEPWRLTAGEGGGGLFMDLASHTLDLLDCLLGPIGEVRGFAVNRAAATPLEDNVVICFRFASGMVGTGAWDFAAAGGADSIEITGTLGRLTCSTFGRRVAVAMADGRQEVVEPPEVAHVHQALARSIVDELLGRGTCPSTGRSAARTAAVMDRALEGYYGGRDDAFWKRSDTWPGRQGWQSTGLTSE